MAGDVHEPFLNEHELLNSDVVGEDGDDRPERPAGPSGASSIRAAAPEVGPPPGRAAASSAATASGAARPGAVREKRKKKVTERATKIMFWLETKYEVLPEVCLSLENWKDAPSATFDFDLLWCDTAISADRFMKLKPYQRMNHFVGMSSITRKNNLGRNLLRMRKQFPKEYKFFPDTWILPTDLSDFKLQFATAKKQTFIVKPDNGCQGKGIFLVRDVEKVPVDFSTTWVAQRYVQKPFLLDGFKFDLRLYVLVLGCDPLRIFLHRRGLVRLASEQYVEPTGKNLSQSMVHLTNYAINKMNPNFEENTRPEDAQDGHKRSWEAVREHLRAEGHDVDALVAEIEDLIVKTLIAVQPSLSHFYHSCQPDDVENAMCFEILGFDVILDSKLQPLLLEVNHAPSFATESELDCVVKTEVLRDTLSLLDMTPDARRQKKREAREKMEQRVMGAVKKQTQEDRMQLEQEAAWSRSVWEDAHLGGYKRLYPSEETERTYMPIHDAAISIWEMLMGGTSRRSVRLTQPTQPSGDDDGKEGKEGKESGDGKVSRRRGERGAPAADPEAGRKAPESREKRTVQELREVADRLMAGISARPRKNEGRRRGGKDGSVSMPPEEEDAAPGDDVDGEHVLPPAQLSQLGSPSKPEVLVGEVIKVQTNLGWEIVTVRAKRANGKLDIQFKDGEYMRSVLPRILHEPSSTEAVVEEAGGPGAPPLLPAPPSAVPRSRTSTANGLSLGLGGLGTRAMALSLPVPGTERPRPLDRAAAGAQVAEMAGGASSSAPAEHPASNIEESLLLLDMQLCTQIRTRRTRTPHAPPEGLPPKPPEPAGMTVVPMLLTSGVGRNTYRGPPTLSHSASPAPGQEAHRGPEFRLRQQLQQLISVRPIVVHRAAVDSGEAARSPRAGGPRVIRRHTFGDN